MDDNPSYKKEDRENLLAVLKKKFSRKKKDDEEEKPPGDEDIEPILKEAYGGKVIDFTELDIIRKIILLPEKDVQDIMTHRKDISAIDGNMTIKNVFDRIMEDGFSRYPVYLDRQDKIVGMFHIRDFLRAYADVSERNKKLIESCHDVVHGVEWAPLTKKISLLLREMQDAKIHMVMIGDEYAQLEGLVTMEDILEEIFGNIQDEHDGPEEELIHIIGKHRYEIDAFAKLDTVGEKLGIEFDNDEIDTMNGFMTEKLGHIPKDGEEFSFSYSGYKFSIELAEENIVKKTVVEKF